MLAMRSAVRVQGLRFPRPRLAPLVLARASSSSTPTSSKTTWSKQRAEEHKQYWDSVLEAVDKPSAKRLLQFLDTSVPLGLAGYGGTRGRSKTKGADGAPLPARPPSYSFFYETKLQHPDKVVLCRVGEFYETIGIDAVLMVQYAGLNPMGKEGNPPRAGCPRANLRRTVADLVENGGLSVVVCEEAPEPYSYGTVRRAPKQRYIAAIVTPALPHFLHNGVDSEVDIPVDSTPPLLGISPSVGGYSVIEVDAELMTVRTTEGLTEDAVYSRLHEGGLVPPLYLHSPPVMLDADTRLRDSVPEVEWKQRMASIFRTQTGTSVVKYSDPDAVTGMLERVKLHLGLRADAEFRRLPSNSPKTRPRPLYFSTASNLGLHRTRGVPSLLDYALPAASPLAARRWLRSLLLQPPEPSVARALHGACEELWKDHGSLPNFVAMSPANVVLKLKSREGNAEFFHELVDLCTVVIQACETPGLQAMTDNLLIAVESDTGVRLDGTGLAAKLLEVRKLIEDVVDEANGHAGRPVQHGQPRLPKSELIPEAFGDISDVLIRMKATNEDFRGKVKDATIPVAVEQVESAWSRVMLEARTCVSLSKEAATSSSSSTSATANKEPALAYDVNNNAAWIKVPRGTKISAEKASILGLIHPRDRNGKVESAVYSTIALEDALDEYRRSCAAAHDAVREQLRELAVSVTPSIPELVGAATFSLIACVLEAHVREATRRGWHLPRITGFDSPRSDVLHPGDHTGHVASTESICSVGKPRSQLKLDGMWPYWLGGPGGLECVARNTFDMDGMFLLTGPNMAGKSTMLRSTAAVALLGACGLAVPAQPTSQIPYIDAFMLRNFSSDSPLEGRSSFAVEMMEMKYVLQDVTDKSLVLVDELGKGTEARAGAALAGAMLEALDRSGCLGAFATHLHDLLEMDLKLDNTTRMKMEVEARDDGSGTGQLHRRPTHRIVPGESVESLALDVARECNLPAATVQRAAELYNESANNCAGATDRRVGRVGRTSVKKSEDNALRPIDPADPADTMDTPGLEDILRSTAGRVLGDHADPLPVHHVPPHALPGTHTTSRSCVYIGHRPSDNRYYVGSSDQLRDRILTHRNPSSGSSSQIRDKDAEFLYIVVPDASAGSSTARTIEAAVIKECIRRGVPLLSTHDASIKSAPPLSTRRRNT